MSTSDRAYKNWWDKLRVFLLCQETAFETQTWPVDIQLSHGEAGAIQLEAEELAEEIGLQDEYRDAVVYNAGPIANAAKRVNKKTNRLLNGRAECVCGRTNKNRHSLLRRKCWEADYKCIAVIEAKRLKAEKEFWKSLAGKECCGTMLKCPLKK